MTVTKNCYVLEQGGRYLNLMAYPPYERALRRDIAEAFHYYSEEFAQQDLDRYRKENPGIPDDIKVRKLTITYKVG